jgi:hypothetical protein
MLLLTSTAGAGEMPNPVPTPSVISNVVQDPATGGEMPNDAADALAQAALDLLAVLPSLL